MLSRRSLFATLSGLAAAALGKKLVAALPSAPEPSHIVGADLARTGTYDSSQTYSYAFTFYSEHPSVRSHVAFDPPVVVTHARSNVIFGSA